MTLKDELLSFNPEQSGSVTADRFDYQRNWAICKLLDLHKKGDDYVMVFEYHDDISVVDSPTNPQRISFYQVKTLKSGTYSISKLIKRDKGKLQFKGSILGKLYRHKIDFNDGVESLNVISNAKYKVILKAEDDDSRKKETICCSDLHDKEIDKIRKALKDEHELEEDPAFEGITYLLVSNIPLEYHNEVTQSNLSKFIEEQFPGIKYQALLIYKSIFDEVRLIGNKQVECTSFEELVSKKSISKERFSEMLSIVTKPYELDELGASIETRLNVENVPMLKIRSFKRQWKGVMVAEMNPTDAHRKLKTAIQGIIKGLTNEEQMIPLWECANLILDRLRASGMPPIYGSDEYLHSLILREYWNGE